MPRKLPVITLKPPAYCANCRTPSDDGDKYTLIGPPERCFWLCNPCFRRLHEKALKNEEKAALQAVKVHRNGNNNLMKVKE